MRGPSHNRDHLVGLKFNRLLVLSLSGYTKQRMLRWRCICDCGRETEVTGAALKRGQIKSCGCLKSESSRKQCIQRSTHGAYRSPAYNSWRCAKGRCFYHGDKSYSQYGGAGITMCERWKNSFAAFLTDMGERPPGTTLDRYPNREGHYEPGNCRWATDLEQAANRRPGSSQRHRKSC